MPSSYESGTNMRVYLDNCSIQRPLDDKSQLRIAVEAECVLKVLDLADAGAISLISSELLEFEIKRTPNIFRRRHAMTVLSLARESARVAEADMQRAKHLVQAGFAALDALHVALAERAGADVFCTCDDDIIRKSRRLDLIRVRVATPVELIEELES